MADVSEFVGYKRGDRMLVTIDTTFEGFTRWGSRRYHAEPDSISVRFTADQVRGGPSLLLRGIVAHELVRKSFVVGGVITEAMGEPPAGSVIWSGAYVYARHHNIWMSTGSVTPINWQQFGPAVRSGNVRLLHLGE